jgi:hypothetical protein
MIRQTHTAPMVVLVALSLLGCAIPPAITPQPTQSASPRVVPPQHAQVLWSSIDASRVVRVHMYDLPEPCETVLANFVREGFALSRLANGRTVAFRVAKWIGIDVETQMVSCISVETRGQAMTPNDVRVIGH